MLLAIIKKRIKRIRLDWFWFVGKFFMSYRRLQV